MDFYLAAAAPIFCILSMGGLLILFLGRAVTALEKSAQAHEKSAKAQQDTVYLLRELVVLKSKEEKIS